MKNVIIALTVILALTAVNAEIHAVIVAGSNGFWNYRHQADVCHAYQTLLKKGVPAKNIILFSYDDAASDPSNPFPNTLYNKPTTGAGWDVNKGCVIDYKGADVTPENYINVLKGNLTAMKGVGTGRVLTSTATDYVFLNFADHGGAGLIAFPNEYLYASDFIAALKYLYDNKMYKQLVYYMEACESGSMWVDLPTTWNLYALSAANQTESSWGTYCPPDDSVNGKEINSCLGDLFSVNWMENTDASNTKTETLEAQFLAVQKLTNKSHVLQWGTQTWNTEDIGVFVGEAANSEFLNKVESPDPQAEYKKNKYAEDSRLIKLNYLYRVWKADPSNTAKEEAYQQEFKLNQWFVEVFDSIKTKAELFSEGPVQHIDFDCLKTLVNHFEAKCHKISEFGLQYVQVLAQVCQASHVEGKTGLIESACTEVTMV